MAVKGSGMVTPTPYTWGEAEYTKPAISALWAVIEAAIAAYSAYTAMKLADDQMDIARRYYNIAKGWWDWYRGAYVPLEDAELDEAINLPIHTPNYDVAIGRAKATARFLFRNKLSKSIKCTSQYSTGVRGFRLKNEATMQAYTLAALEGMGYRNERLRIDALNARRWARREAVVNRGRDLMASNVSYGQIAGAILGDLAGQAAKAAGGAMYALGYTLNRNETRYNPYMYYSGVQRRQEQSFVGPPQPGWVQPDSQIGWQDTARTPFVPPDSQIDWDSRNRFVGPPEQTGAYATARRINDMAAQPGPVFVQPDSQIDWESRHR